MKRPCRQPIFDTQGDDQSRHEVPYGRKPKNYKHMKRTCQPNYDTQVYDY